MTCCNHGHDGRTSKTVAGALERPRYSPGIILEDSDLNAAVAYTRGLNQLLFRSLFGCGVICGLEVGVDDKCGAKVTVAAGLALDGRGDPLQLPGKLQINDVRELAHGENEPPPKQEFWVLLCGRDKHCAPRTVVCDDPENEGPSQHTRIRAQTEVSIVFDPPKCACGLVNWSDDPRGERRAQLVTWLGNGAESGRTNIFHKTDQNPSTCADPCADDCGCGGCCVLLAYGRWSGGGDGKWNVYHRGVRRFIRPAAPDYANDPIDNPAAERVAEAAETPAEEPAAQETPSPRRGRTRGRDG